VFARGRPEFSKGAPGVELNVMEMPVVAPVVSVRLLMVPSPVASVQLVGDGEPDAPKFTPTKVLAEAAVMKTARKTISARAVRK